MSSIVNSSEENIEDYIVSLPCAPNEFGEFISGLLGKPQSTRKGFNGTFSITKENINELFQLINSRIVEQNTGQFIQFVIEIFYKENTSVRLNNIEEFMAYSEMKPLTSIRAILSWTYLIKFNNANVPEKQEIDLVFDTSGRLILEDEDIYFHNRQGISCSIRHTNRTWGMDIESLITGHINKIMKMPNKFNQVLYKHNILIGISSGVILFMSLANIIYQNYQNYQDIYLKNITDGANKFSKPLESIQYKLNHLFDYILSGTINDSVFSLYLSFLIAFIISIVFGSFIGSLVNNRPKSFLLLSDLAKEYKKEFIEKRNRRWLLLVSSIIGSIVIGLLTNYLYAKFIEKLI
ncbi:MAG: hypothetical protein KAI79_02520 [Bacteroidales bacterium]|nr:hypothetical protein [Bacteroidales bacterium]